MFEQAFKNIDDVLRKEAGCTTELDYTEQTSWLLFLKYLDSLEQDRATEAALDHKKYAFLLDKPYRWETWAAPKSKDGQLDHHKALSGDDLRDFVNANLFPYLHGFTQRPPSSRAAHPHRRIAPHPHTVISNGASRRLFFPFHFL
ncbi:MAG TPA: type I restriction-modification system subunit M N-terminal domain-containing protein [Candidatus Acidoferrum sp.]|jgi:type I restriction enzyme M protein